MLNLLNEAVNEWCKRRQKESYIAGYDYAAGALLRGEETPASLDNKTGFEPNHPFDKGIMDAINRLIKNNYITDDRG